jgi:hypothetical protein
MPGHAGAAKDAKSGVEGATEEVKTRNGVTTQGG